MANQMITTERAAADLSEVVARLVAEAVAAERERCAQVAEGERLENPPDNPGDEGYENAIRHVAAAIRAQGSKT